MNVVIFITCAKKGEAKKIAHALVSKKLAACVNIIPGIESWFRWQGKVDKAEEYLLVVKSKKKYFSRLSRLVKSLHSYAVPEIIACPLVFAEKNYLNWLDESFRASP
jgi:periplasmic divalent cation tolerance protein